MAKTTNASDKFIVRLPDGMRDELKAAAVANGRTMNAEIVARIAKTDTDTELLDQFASQAMEIIFHKNEIAKMVLDKAIKENVANVEDAFAMWCYTMAAAMINARGRTLSSEVQHD